MKTAAEIVNYLVRHYKKDDPEIEAESAQVDDLAADLGEMIGDRLEGDTPYGETWDAFLADPEANSYELTGALEAVFEAEPGMRERVDGYMQKITAIEVTTDEDSYVPSEIEEDLQIESGEVVGDEPENSVLIAEGQQEKNPPVYLYGNARAGVETVEDTPVSNPFMVGDNAEIIYVPTEEMRFPQMFMHLGRLSETSEDLEQDDKEKLAANLTMIRAQLVGDQTFDAGDMANAFETIWEISPSYANALIESLQRHPEELPEKGRQFVTDLDTPLHQ
ncbi:hypothetical protein KQH62_03205 [bacterium]|nr:hypothetical protein [bacterium]